MEIVNKIKGCIDCPFRNYQYDDFAIGNPVTNHCNILKEKWAKDVLDNKKNIPVNYLINFKNSGKVKSKNKKTLDNCPLLSNDFLISLKKENNECCGTCKCDNIKPSPPPPPPNRILKEGEVPRKKTKI